MILRLSASQAVAAAVEPLRCRYCFSPVDEPFAHPVTRQIVTDICVACADDDLSDFAGITRDEARADEAGYEPED